ncbi:MAG: sterol desaturase family protein [Candidatus Melainabacteria bacterium HGW-Melainabacteria-1]|nr:MAG: sterol desaturase family protein [Candidatus Melainabacteria bacterium HGW-Melainabacteria-1]
MANYDMQSVNYIQLALPVFFVAIGIEALVAWRTRKDWYSLHDSVANLACGSLEQLAELAYKTLIFAVYVLLYEHLRLANWPLESVLAWISCFILVDLGYYWYHRASHRIWLLWAGHGPHHQSEEYNLTVALRQGALERAGSWLFWLPLAIAGFHPLMYLACAQFNNIYQFFIHTRAIDRLGPLEAVFNTPSHHRVHHGKNPAYIDKNFGGVLIIWDRLFGSFAPEQEAPVFGTVSPLRSWNPLWANWVFYVEMAQYMKGLTLLQRLQLPLKPPGWHPDRPEPEIPLVDATTYSKYNTPRQLKHNLLLSLHFGLLLLITTGFLELVKQLNPGQVLLGSGALAMGFIVLAGLIEGRSWYWRAEGLLRLPLSLIALWLLPLPLSVQTIGSLISLLMGLAGLYLQTEPQSSAQPLRS